MKVFLCPSVAMSVVSVWVRPQESVPLSQCCYVSCLSETTGKCSSVPVLLCQLFEWDHMKGFLCPSVAMSVVRVWGRPQESVPLPQCCYVSCKCLSETTEKGSSVPVLLSQLFEWDHRKVFLCPSVAMSVVWVRPQERVPLSQCCYVSCKCLRETTGKCSSVPVLLCQL